MSHDPSEPIVQTLSIAFEVEVTITDIATSMIWKMNGEEFTNEVHPYKNGFTKELAIKNLNSGELQKAFLMAFQSKV